MKVLRVLLAGLAMVIVAGTIAGASPHIVSTFTDSQVGEEVTPSESPEPSESPSIEPSESPSPDPSDVSDDEEGSEATGPDFSACVGLTGLENAICRHEALLALKPENPGLENSLTHLQDNLARHLEKAALKQGGESHGQSGVSHGQSGESHGQSGVSQGQSGESHGQSGVSHGQSGESHGHQ